MNKTLETWCYGGQSKAFFIEQGKAIHQYNTKMMDRLLFVITVILGCYVVTELCNNSVGHYLTTYLACFAILLVMCIEKGKETVVYYSPTFGMQGLLILFVIPIWLFCEVKWQVIDPGREKERKKRQAKTQPD